MSDDVGLNVTKFEALFRTQEDVNMALLERINRLERKVKEQETYINILRG